MSTYRKKDKDHQGAETEKYDEERAPILCIVSAKKMRAPIVLFMEL